jgi:hypothetical protein
MDRFAAIAADIARRARAAVPENGTTQIGNAFGIKLSKEVFCDDGLLRVACPKVDDLTDSRG